VLGIGSWFIVPGYHPKKILRFLHAYLSALFFRKRDSLIVIQRIHSNFIYANLLLLLVKVRNSATIYDLDDADYLDHPPKTICAFLKNCSMVTVGSQELKKNLMKFNKSIIINTSPTPDLKIGKKNKNEVLTIGWIGCFGGGHKQSMLKDFFPALKCLPFNVKLVMMGVFRKADVAFLINYFSAYENVQLEIPLDINWQDEFEVQRRIAALDIGIATLLDDEFQRSKSAFKVKQYLNNGVPVLSSNIPENNLFVIHGRNGFFCSSPGDFRRRIIGINEMDQSTYSKFSKQARLSSKEFGIASYCEKLKSIYGHRSTC
jgi:glycosyltransferase involved in cell wall biosynthesis